MGSQFDRRCIFTKVYAYLDRETDLDDLRHLRPTAEEVAALEPWLREVDANPEWPRYLTGALTSLLERLEQPPSAGEPRRGRR